MKKHIAFGCTIVSLGLILITLNAPTMVVLFLLAGIIPVINVPLPADIMLFAYCIAGMSFGIWLIIRPVRALGEHLSTLLYASPSLSRGGYLTPLHRTVRSILPKAATLRAKMARHWRQPAVAAASDTMVTVD